MAKRTPKQPVPPEVGESFTNLQNARRNASNAYRGRSAGQEAAAEARHYDTQAARGNPATPPKYQGPSAKSVARRAAANEEVDAAATRAAGHFGGDAGKMMGHFGRWVRSAGRAMSAADFILPKETIDQTMDQMEERQAGGKQRLKIIRKQSGGTVGNRKDSA
jgi:hypothetical protein